MRVLAIALLTSTADSDMSTLLECLHYIIFSICTFKREIAADLDPRKPADDETSISGFYTKIKRALERARVKMAAICRGVL